VTEGFSDNIYLGWPPINFVNKWLIIPIFNFLENYIGNYGIIIIILVLVIKILLAPLSYKSYVSMAKTKVLKPELDEIKAKHPDDMQKAQQEQMKLYQQVGVNPLSGCIPLLLQMPILFAMFYMFPNSIELRQEAFLWADDLSTYDSILSLPFNIPVYGDHVSLFTILMTASTILYTWSNNQITTVQGPMKTFSYLMPIIFMFVLNSFPASLSFYYFVSNIVTFGQQALIRRFVDEDKIKAILDENRLKNKGKKKSVFQLKLEEAMRTKEDAKKKKSK
jgi:YidC/Oxa1 family membrane protein insertase